MSKHLRRLGSNFTIEIPADQHGYTGRECPECRSYFKVAYRPGCDDSPNCICPYCGCGANQSEFATADQIEYTRSVVLKKLTGALRKDLKDMARSFTRKSSGGLISAKMRIRSRSPRIRYYNEIDLETNVECNHCTIKYAIYGVFGFCPECRTHNSLQILEKNLELVRKQLALADATGDCELREHLIGDALENAVSAFDGFGRQTAESHAELSTNPNKIAKLSFQNLDSANKSVEKLFGFKLNSDVNSAEWSLLVRCFNKRHLLAHRMGVIDEKYATAVVESQSMVGRKVATSAEEVALLLDAVYSLGSSFITALDQSPCVPDS